MSYRTFVQTSEDGEIRALFFTSGPPPERAIEVSDEHAQAVRKNPSAFRMVGSAPVRKTLVRLSSDRFRARSGEEIVVSMEGATGPVDCIVNGIRQTLDDPSQPFGVLWEGDAVVTVKVAPGQGVYARPLVLKFTEEATL